MMSQIKQISQTLKSLLRQQQITYRDIAQHLTMSEANVKRIFSSQNFTLERLEQICDLLKISLSDLFELSQKQTPHVSQLTEEQENELLESPELLLIAICVRDGWSFQEMIDYYAIDKHQCIQLLAKLDRLKIIHLLPNNHYKSLISEDFRWIPGGKLERYIESEVLEKFMSPGRDEPWHFRFYLRGRYSQNSINLITKRLNQLTKEAAELNREDSQLPQDQKRHFGLLLAMRPWEPELFKSMRRTK